MTSTSKLDDINSGFFNHAYLNAVYSNKWREFKYVNEVGTFKYCPVLHAIPETPYFYSDCWRGYFDPHFSCYEPSFIVQALQAYSAWCKENNIICEMIRIDPLSPIKNISFDKVNFQIATGQPVSQIRMPKSIDEYYSMLPAPCQRNIKKARKTFFISQVQASDIQELKKISVILNQSLARSKAANKWFLKEQAFLELAALNEFKFIAIKNIENDDVISFAGFIFHKNSCQILLVGNGDNTQNSGASDLLYFAIVEFCIEKYMAENFIDIISFGGGRSLSIDDPLIRFKLKYSLKQYTNCLYLILDHAPEITKQLNSQQAHLNQKAGEPISQLHSIYFPFLVK